MNHKPVIAIDGTAASGKGTLARKLAALYGFAYLDTGLLYRYAGMQGLIRAIDIDDAEAATALTRELAAGLDPNSLADPVYRSAEAGPAASRIGFHPGVRQALMDLQRNFADASPLPGAVLDGRDIGTVICPDAPVKFFVTATPEARAHRRFLELGRLNPDLTYETILADMLERDRRDAERDAAPMKAAHDAIFIDTSEMTVEQVAAFAASHIRERLGCNNILTQNSDCG